MSRQLRKAYRDICGYTHTGGGVTIDSDGNTIERFPSEEVLEYVVNKSSSYQKPLSREDFETLHKEAEIFFLRQTVQETAQELKNTKWWVDSKKQEADQAADREKKAADEIKAAKAEYERLLEALKKSELRVHCAVNAHASQKKYAVQKMEESEFFAKQIPRLEQLHANAVEALKSRTS
jgi:microsomal dipeptidase-like Zn-dependent dipeptidase